MIGDFFSGAAKAFGLAGKGISGAAKFASSGAKLSGSAWEVKNRLTRIGIGYLGYQGVTSVANQIESSEELSNRIGGFWTGAAKVGAGAAFGLSTANKLARTAGVLGAAASKTSMVKSAFAPKQYDNIVAGSEALRTGGLNKWFNKGAKGAGKFAGQAGLAVAKAPFMPLYDISRMAHKGTKYLNESHGARALGWGMLAGSGALAQSIANDEYTQSNSGRNLSMSGKQMYVPTSGEGPRRMTDNLDSTSGLTLALHKLR